MVVAYLCARKSEELYDLRYIQEWPVSIYT